MVAKKGLYYNMNKRKKAGTSRSKKNSTISPKAYANMKKGFPKKKKIILIPCQTCGETLSVIDGKVRCMNKQCAKYGK